MKLSTLGENEKRCAPCSAVMPGARRVADRDTSVRDPSSMGRTIQGTHDPKNLVRGHIDRGHIAKHRF